MNKLLSIALLTGLTMQPLKAKDTNYHVVFENSSSDSKVWEALLNNVENTRKALGIKTEVEVVSHGEGIGLLLEKEKFHVERMRSLRESGVRFKACENTMVKKNIKRNELVKFAQPVDSGVAEVIRKQHDGWSYVKSGN